MDLMILLFRNVVVANESSIEIILGNTQTGSRGLRVEGDKKLAAMCRWLPAKREPKKFMMTTGWTGRQHE